MPLLVRRPGQRQGVSHMGVSHMLLLVYGYAVAGQKTRARAMLIEVPAIFIKMLRD
jgi:hypothetical protein